MERYVVSRELAEKLLDSDYPQARSQFIWVKRTEASPWIVLSSRNYDKYLNSLALFDAPLSDELLEQLPKEVPFSDGNIGLKVSSQWSGGWRAHYGVYDHASFIRSTPADALAELWLWCNERGYIIILADMTDGKEAAR